MMFSRDDLRINSAQEFIEFLPIFVFVALVAPFLLLAYKLGFVMKMVGWLNTSD